MANARRPALDTINYGDRPRILPRTAPPAIDPNGEQADAPATPTDLTAKGGTGRPPGRAGKRAVAFWLDPVAHKQLRSLALQRDTNLQALMEEAADDLFAKYNLHRLAATSRG